MIRWFGWLVWTVPDENESPTFRVFNLRFFSRKILPIHAKKSDVFF